MITAYDGITAGPRLQEVPAGRLPFTRILLLGLGTAFLATACSSDPEPSYLRINGNVPASAALPAKTLVVFWASWCAPCIEEAPGLASLAASPPADLELVLFSHDDTQRPALERFAGSPAITIRQDDRKAVADGFGVERLPAAFLVVDGALVARFDGPRDWGSPAMRKLLERLATTNPG